ncbi:MAG: GNAT family N-acetyltransferase [Thermoanaerobaculia bacterium]|nr:GNAT family N-acetyltransferase [Thermoanaerobaculia bacterium]
MNRSFTISQGRPENDFWEKYAVLWRNSPERSPFQAPQLLQYFAGKSSRNTVVFQCLEANQLIGAVLLQEHKGVCSFLSDLKTDANFFVIDRTCSPDAVRDFFTCFMEMARREKWSLILNNQPAWATYMPALEAAGRASGLFWSNFGYSVCPIAEAETPEALYNRINGSREHRYRVNKLKNQANAEFEVLTDDTDLENWANEFCNAHVLRWTDTPTPSDFRDPARRQFLLDCLQAWCRDGLLVRFSVKVEQKRIGFVVGLREAGSLIHHSTTFHPGFWKFSPGKALIHFMAQWMRDNNLRVLDFGDGDEAYKYEIADREHVLNRIFSSNKRDVKFMAKAKIIKMVKDHPGVYHFYQHRLKPVAAQLVGLEHLLDWLWSLL